MKPLSRKKTWLLSAYGLAAFFAAWELLGRSGLFNAALIPTPSRLPAVAWAEIQNGKLQASLLSSLRHYSTGVVAGTLLGIAMGVGAGLSNHLRAFQEWIVRVLRPVPPIAWIPFAIIWFGVSTTAAAFMIAIGTFWLNYFATLSAVLAVDRDYLELARAFHHDRFASLLCKIILPAASPGILSGVRSGLGQGWMLVVAAELFGIQGIGQRMTEAAGLLAIDVVVVYMLVIAAVYSIFDGFFVRFENLLLQWQRSE